MSFRYDMKDKSPQARAIVAQRDAQDKALKEKSKVEKFEQKNIKGSRIKRVGDYEAVSFLLDNKVILELRVSGTAIANGPCKLSKDSIGNWLWETGLTFVEEIKEPTILLITSRDVLDSKLITDWKQLNKE